MNNVPEFNQHDRKHYYYPRTQREAFGYYDKSEVEWNNRDKVTIGHDVVLVLVLMLVIFILSIGGV